MEKNVKNLLNVFGINKYFDFKTIFLNYSFELRVKSFNLNLILIIKTSDKQNFLYFWLEIR